MENIETQPSRSQQQVVKPFPCPFCGSDKITVEWEPCPPLDATDTNRRWFAECSQCSCQGPFCQKEPQVIPAWNRRTAKLAFTFCPRCGDEMNPKHDASARLNNEVSHER